ncbi:MAG: SufS family cysteine desulfurase [Alistipes sp.]|jgi:cysteine desulfurase/selenocysteine lyase|nr:SufS family cysteine desulfurase [Alistipes sp.]
MERTFDITSVREDFPILGRKVYGRPLVYLDSAATAQKPRRVIDAMVALVEGSNANVHRGTHLMADESTSMYEAARETVRGFIGAAEREEIIFTPGATASLNLASRSLCELLVGEGDNVIVGKMEHHSNIVPWQLACLGEIRPLPFTEEGLYDPKALEALIDERTRVVAVTQCSNVLGTRSNMARIAEIAHRYGVVVVVDGCQGVVHGTTNVRELDCDIYAFSGHKLYGPTGIGVLYGKRELLERMPPVLGGGNMIATVSFTGSKWTELPYKFEPGTPNFVGAVGMAEAIKYIGEFEPGDIERHEAGLLDAATRRLGEIGGLHIHGTAPGKAPIISFTVEGVHGYDLGVLLDKQGVAVRTGTHCAQPLVDHYGSGSMCRASFAMYNTVEEVDALVAGVVKAVSMLRK